MSPWKCKIRNFTCVCVLFYEFSAPKTGKFIRIHQKKPSIFPTKKLGNLNWEIRFAYTLLLRLLHKILLVLFGLKCVDCFLPARIEPQSQVIFEYNLPLLL